MPQECHEKVKELASVFSAPIFDPHDRSIILGVLNMDSREDNSKTLVNDEGVRAIFERVADEIYEFMPPRGVA
jgi:hypothetical protein